MRDEVPTHIEKPASRRGPMALHLGPLRERSKDALKSHDVQ